MNRRRYIWIVIIMAVLLAALVCIAVMMRSKKYTVRVVPKGESVVTLEYGEPYTEQGAVAKVEGHENAVLNIETIGSVDTGKVGKYTICYVAHYNGFRAEAYRYVHVVDTQAPELVLIGETEQKLVSGEVYEEDGYTAVDGYDGDLTDQVIRTEENGLITYRVTDAAGNTATVIRTLITIPKISGKPVVALKGKKTISLFTGDRFTEPGYTATDDEDGEMTQQVQVTGEVNVFIPGEYTVTYRVTDSSGNVATNTRKVVVNERSGGKLNDPAAEGKVIYLTFDDGPSGYTPQLLDILKKYNVPVTFFVVNTGNIATIQRAAEEGHVVAIHTKTHVFKDIYASESAFYADLEGMQAIIESYTGKKPMMMRFPGGSSNTTSRFNPGIMTRLTRSVTENGYVYFDWNVDSLDAGGANTPPQVFENVVNGVRGRENSVVLLHDIMWQTVDAIEDIIIWALDNGYVFRVLTEDGPTCHHKVFN